MSWAIALMFYHKFKENGFSLVEMLIAIAIIGILAAIVVPTVLGHVNKARLAEAKAIVGTINHAQQAYFLENSQFAPNFRTLAIEPPTSPGYRYVVQRFPTEAIAVARPRDRSLRGVGGRVWVFRDSQNRITIQSILCEGQPGTTPFMSRRTRCF